MKTRLEEEHTNNFDKLQHFIISLLLKPGKLNTIAIFGIERPKISDDTCYHDNVIRTSYILPCSATPSFLLSRLRMVLSYLAMILLTHLPVRYPS